jgi:hypothetical protein
MAATSGTNAPIPKRYRFMRRRLRPNRPIVNAGRAAVQDFQIGPF